MLDQVFMPCTIVFGILNQFGHYIPLMVTWKDQTFFFVFTSFRIFFVFNIQVNKTSENIQQIFRR